MSRRTETAYKAKSPGELAQHNKAQRFRRYGKCCGCIAKVHALIRGGLLNERSGIAMGAGLRPVLKEMDEPPYPKGVQAAPQGEIHGVIEQESAEVIVSASKRRRTEHKAGKEPQ